VLLQFSEKCNLHFKNTFFFSKGENGMILQQCQIFELMRYFFRWNCLDIEAMGKINPTALGKLCFLIVI
jgi:hypothetical protein